MDFVSKKISRLTELMADFLLIFNRTSLIYKFSFYKNLKLREYKWITYESLIDILLVLILDFENFTLTFGFVLTCKSPD